MATLHRRSLLGTALAVGGGVAVPSNGAPVNGLPPASDAAVIRLCGELIELRAVEFAIYDGPNPIRDDDAAACAAAPARARMDEIIAGLGAVRAATAAGVLARARALAAFNGCFGASFDYPEDDGAGRMLAFLMRDAAAIGAPLPEEVADPDRLRGEA